MTHLVMLRFTVVRLHWLQAAKQLLASKTTGPPATAAVGAAALVRQPAHAHAADVPDWSSKERSKGAAARQLPPPLPAAAAQAVADTMETGDAGQSALGGRAGTLRAAPNTAQVLQEQPDLVLR